MKAMCRMLLIGCPALVGLGLAGLSAVGADIDPPAMTTVEVTITNMTKGQPLSPPILVSHAPDMHIFQVGKMASTGLQQLAETGMSDELAGMCKGKATDCQTATMDQKIMPGKSLTMKVKCKPGDVISLASMVAATNDGFVGIDGAKVGDMMMEGMKKKGDDAKRDDGLMMKDGMLEGTLMALDAGTEENTEKKTDTAAPDMGKGHVATTPQAPISMHKGIKGVGDLDKEMFGWDGPVAKVEIKMMK